VSRRNCQSAGLIFLLSLLSIAAAIAQTKNPPCAQCAEWNKPQAPFRIFGNSYYVGTHGLSSILIPSKAGHILIDGDLPESAKQIVEHIRSLGFRVEDVKIILNSHVHFDHAGGIAELQRLSGARVMASPWSAAVMRQGTVGRGDPQYGITAPIAAVRNVHELQDGETLRVGEIAITAHFTPGHTPGGTSWTWKSCEGIVCHDMVYADSLTPISADGFKFTTSRVYPHALQDFEKSFAFLEAAPCDILITVHPEASDLWNRLDARQRGTSSDPMVNSSACRQLAEQGRERLRERIAEEKPPHSGPSN
jgi:metallo-beta-lactamase class B